MISAGFTNPTPGGNEQLKSLDCKTFIFLNSDSIFYYFTSSNEASLNNTFRCGYFNITDRKMTDIMKSQVNYFDVNVSPNGRHLAALSRNGNMIKISIIDIYTKKLIYSSLYSDIYDYSFSPDEKNVIIHGRADNRRNLKVISIDWTEE
jgi:WD40 repeat protein